MKIYKKTLSFFLSLMLVIGTFTAIPAFAAEETKSSDATLSALTYKVGDDGADTGVAGFDSSTDTYNVELPSGTDKSAKITLEGTVTDTDKAKVTKNDGVTLADGQGTATITVTAEDETTKTYTVNFTIKAAPAEYTLSISEAKEGGVGYTRTITVGGTKAGTLTDKYLVAEVTEGSGTGAKVSVVMTALSATTNISYQSENAKVEAWIVGSSAMPSFTGTDIEGKFDAHANA